MPKRKFEDSQIVSVSTDASASTIARLTSDLRPDLGRGHSFRNRRRKIHQAISDLAKTQTPYGNVAQDLIIDGIDGPMPIYFASPFAFLYVACDKSPRFANMLATMLRDSGGNLDIVYYLDKARPGNPLMPCAGRLTQCMYWSIVQFPHWWRSRENGWMPLSYIFVKDQESANVPDSMLVRDVVRLLNNERSCFSLTSGFAVPSGDGRMMMVKVRRQLTVSDWEQTQKTFSLKGPNGTVPCGICQNVVGRRQYFPADGTLVHVHSPEYDKFEMRTTASFSQAVELLKSTARTNPGKLKHFEQCLGIKYEPHGVMFDDATFGRLSPPMAMFPDWMHDFVASGGVAQWELNNLINVLGEKGIGKEDIDAWAQRITLPRSYAYISKTFFQDRVTANGHIKAFASEVLACIELICFFLDEVVRSHADDELVRYLDCFALLRIILTILKRGLSKDIPLLRRVIQMHHVLYFSLHKLIPKIHNAAHIADFWAYWGCLLSCFGPERHHRLLKKVMSWSYRGAQRTTLCYDVWSWMDRLGKDSTHIPYHLIGTIKPVNLSICGVSVSATSASMQTPLGGLVKNDLLQYKQNGRLCIGFINCFAQCGGNDKVFVVVVPCVHLVSWRRGDASEICIVEMGAICGPVFYYEDAGIVHAHFLPDS